MAFKLFRKKEEEKKEEHPAKKEKIQAVRPKKGFGGIKFYGILKSPLITEKGTILEKFGKYIFKVGARANKIMIKKAVEDRYGVKVKEINIINIHPKRRRWRRVVGFKSGYRKAIVTLAEGEKLEIGGK